MFCGKKFFNEQLIIVFLKFMNKNNNRFIIVANNSHYG